MKRVSEKQAKRNKKLAGMKPPRGGKCQECGNLPGIGGLQKHHKTRRSDGGKDTKRNIKWLCQECHDKQYGEKSRDKRKPEERIIGISGFHGLKYPPLPEGHSLNIPNIPEIT